MSSAALLKPQTNQISRALQLLELIRQTSVAPDRFALAALLSDARDLLDAGIAAYCHSIPEPDKRVLLNLHLACVPALAYDVHERGLDEVQSWIEYAREHTEPTVVELSSRSTHEHSGDGDWRRQFHSTLLIPTHSGGAVGRFGLLILGSPARKYFEDPANESERLLAQTLATVLHAWWVNRTRRELSASANLNARDLRILSMERQGMVTKEMAEVLGTSVRSIDHRFSRIGLLLGTANRRDSAFLLSSTQS